MKYESPKSPTLADAKSATGKAAADWFAVLDAAGGVAKGRKALSDHLFKELKVDAWWATTLVAEYEKARGAKEKDGKAPGYAICVTKSIAAPAKAVYSAFTDSATLTKWFGAKATCDAKDGGSFETADGERGEFLRVRENKDLRFRWDDANRGAGSQVDVAFKEAAGKTGITLNHARIQERQHADELRAAWGAAFDALKALLEKK
jgi:uncharacterized protein YndB with AHSA1/START domain